MTLPAFTRKLLKWNKKENSRQMPWKYEKDPYKIWLSEIILQQTRVKQGHPYYEKFLRYFPTVRDLAAAPRRKVFKLWEGLGYYNRCRNLIETANKIVKDYKGKFPDSFKKISALKGIGPYTAAAIGSFAFKLPYPVVDGNVHRVLSRYFGITTGADQATGRKFYASLAFALLDKKNPDIYNQAIMDFGAVICKPRNPLCETCIQSEDCMAYQNGWVDILPVKKIKQSRRLRWFYYFIFENDSGQLFIRRRNDEDIWKHLYEFYLLESDRSLNKEKLYDSISLLFGREAYRIKSFSKVFKQELTHQIIQGQFVSIWFKKSPAFLRGFLPVSRKKIRDYPFPKFIQSFIVEQDSPGPKSNQPVK
ncbi:MAG: A/G-specific adenine glycosylase [Chitinophagales bacterium]